MGKTSPASGASVTTNMRTNAAMDMEQVPGFSCVLIFVYIYIYTSTTSKDNICVYIYIHSIYMYTPPGVYEDDKDIYTYIKLYIYIIVV